MLAANRHIVPQRTLYAGSECQGRQVQAPNAIQIRHKPSSSLSPNFGLCPIRPSAPVHSIPVSFICVSSFFSRDCRVELISLFAALLPKSFSCQTALSFHLQRFSNFLTSQS